MSILTHRRQAPGKPVDTTPGSDDRPKDTSLLHGHEDIRYFVIAVFAFLAAFSGCATAPYNRPMEPGKTALTGVASFYGHGFQGKKTASGERFSKRDFTAAHRTLPFGTRVKVTNLDNGKSVIVRINDRGPYKKKRIIDLSLGAAKKIGMLQNGTARVQLKILK
jgi:rare lipoprotein A